MDQNISRLTDRFHEALTVMMQNLGPQLITRAQLELTPGQAFMLNFIKKNGQLTVSSLADKMEVAPSAITVMLDRLEKRKFVLRVRDQRDRRVVLVLLTEEGHRALGRVINLRKRAIQQCLEKISLDELAIFVKTLEKLSDISQTVDIQSMVDFDNPQEA